MDIPADVAIVGIESIVLDADAGELRLRLALSDGSVAATFWPIDQLRSFVGVVEGPRHAPTRQAAMN